MVHILAAAAAITLIYAAGRMNQQNGLLFGGSTSDFSTGWKGPDGQSVQLPGIVTANSDGAVTLRNTLPSDLPDGAVLYISSSYQSADVSIDGHTVFSWRLENKAFFIRSFGLPCYMVAIPSSSASKSIELHLQTNSAGEEIQIYALTLGDAVTVTVAVIEEHIDTVILFFILAVLFGLLVALVVLYRKQLTGYARDAAIFSAFIALAATWMITDSPLAFLFSKNIVVTLYISTLSQMLLSAPMVLFMRRFIHRGRRLLVWLAGLVFLNFFVCLGLLIFGVADLIQTLFTTHILQLASCIAVIVLSIMEYIRFKRRDIFEVFAGYLFLCLFGIVSVLGFSLSGDPDNSVFVRLGVTLFVLTLGFGVIRRGISELAQSKSYRSITLSIPSGICRLSDIDSSSILYANAFYYMMFGYTETSARISGFTTAEFTVLPSDLEPMRKKISESLATGRTTFETEARHRKKDGETIWVLSRYTIDPKDKGALTAVMIDITDRKRTEDRLRISEEEYRIATRHSNKLIIRLDVATKTTYRQSDIPSVLGVPNIVHNVPDSIIESGRVAQDSIEALRDFYNAIYNGSREVSAVVSLYDVIAGEYRWYHFNSTSIFDEAGKPVQAIISFFDVTLQRQKELAFQRWQQSFNAIPKSAANFYEYNVTTDAFEHGEGGMLPPLPEHVPPHLSDVASYIAGQHIFRDDAKAWLDFMDRERLLARYTEGKHTDRMEFRRTTGDTPMWTSLSLQLIPDPYSSDIKGYFLLEDVDEQKKAQIYLHERSTLDSLTGLLNRITFIEKFNAILSTSGPEAQHALIMLDVDNFKTINDSLGHNVGDELLVQIAGKLKVALRSDDLCGRLGGDEFVICLKNMNLGKPLESRVDDLCTLLYDDQKLGVAVSASFGVAGYPDDGMTFDDLYQKADIALYKAKAHGRGRYAVYDPQLTLDDFSLTAKH